MATLELKNINKVYDNGVQAVFDFNLNIEDKEFIVFVGPSGCGKSTTLRMIAGLEEITDGELYIDGELMNDVAPKDRNIAMVFQSYALYPHMTVYNNMAFGLQLRKVPKEEIKQKVTETAQILGLTPYLDRKPKALSGGQRQRVALGRAIVRNAKVFLMDEPLSNLDAKLRVTMRTEIIKLHERIGSTTIYVTHDQIEAMTMASRIVVMKDGYIQQVGAPKDIYDYPVNMFVAGFIGTPPMNFIPGVIDESGMFKTADNDCSVRIPQNKLEVIEKNGFINKPIVLGVRPENIYDDKESLVKFADSVINIKVDVSELLGASTNIYCIVGGSNVCAVVPPRADLKMNSEIELAMDLSKCHIFDPETEKNISLNAVEVEVEEIKTVVEEETEDIDFVLEELKDIIE